MQDLFRRDFNYVIQKQNTAASKVFILYRKTCVKRSLSKGPKIGFQDQVSLDADQKYCRMLKGELPIVIKISLLCLF